MECEVCGKKLDQWSARFDNDTLHCKGCLGTDAAKAVHALKAQGKPVTDEHRELVTPPPDIPSTGFNIALCGWVIFAISVIAGVLLFPEDGYSYDAPASLYMPGVLAICFGVFQLCLLIGVGKLITVTAQITR